MIDLRKGDCKEVLKTLPDNSVDSIVHTCPVCGIVFHKKVYKNVQAVYCSQSCAYKGRSTGVTKRVVKIPYNGDIRYVKYVVKITLRTKEHKSIVVENALNYRIKIG